MSRTCSTEHHNDGMERIEDELVRFDNVKACYHMDAGSRVTLTYNLSDASATTPQDWIGLFPSNRTDILQPLASTPTPTKSKSRKKKKNKGRDDDKRQVNFPLDNVTNLGKATHQLYQFVYVSKSGRVLGASRAFTIQGEEPWNLEGDEDHLSQSPPLPRSTSPLQDSEISILCLENTGSTESPVILSYPSDGEVDWEIPNLSDAKEKEESALSEFSDIEILSTSPSKDDTRRYTSVPSIPEDGANASLSKNEVAINDCLKNEEEEKSPITRSQRKRARKNKKKELVTNGVGEEERNEQVNPTVITESLVEKLQFVDLGESSNAENGNLSDLDEARSGNVSRKKGRKKRRKERARQLITELSPKISYASIPEAVNENDIEENAQICKKSRGKKRNHPDKVDKVTIESEQTRANPLSINNDTESKTTRGLNDSSRKASQNCETSAFRNETRATRLSMNKVTDEKPIKGNKQTKWYPTNNGPLVYFNENICSETNHMSFSSIQNSNSLEVDRVNNTKKSKDSRNRKISKGSNVLINNKKCGEESDDVMPCFHSAQDSVMNNNEPAKVLGKKDVNNKKSKTAEETDVRNNNFKDGNRVGAKAQQVADNIQMKVLDVVNSAIKLVNGSDHVTKGKKRKIESNEENERETKLKNGKINPVTCQQRMDIEIIDNAKFENDDVIAPGVKTNEAESYKKSKVDSNTRRKEKKRKQFESLRKEIEINNTEKRNGILAPEICKNETDVLKFKGLGLKIEIANDNKHTNDCNITGERHVMEEPKQETGCTNTASQRKVQINAFSGSGPILTVTSTTNVEMKELSKISGITEKEGTKTDCRLNKCDSQKVDRKSNRKRKLEKLEKQHSLAVTPLENSKELAFSSQNDRLKDIENISNYNKAAKVMKCQVESEEATENNICPLLEKEMRIKEYRKKYAIVAKSVKRVKMKAALKAAVRKEKRAKRVEELTKNVLQINPQMDTEYEKDFMEDGEDKNEVQEEKSKNCKNAPKLTSPPNDVINFPPLDKPMVAKELFAEGEKCGLRAWNSNKPDVSLKKKKSSKLGNICSPFMIKAANSAMLTNHGPPRDHISSSSIVTPFQVCLLDIMDAVPEDPSAFNFIQWQKKKALAKVENKQIGVAKQKTFRVADKVSNLKKMTENTLRKPQQVVSPSSNSATTSFGNADDGNSGVGALTSYANVLKGCKDITQEENKGVKEVMETNNLDDEVDKRLDGRNNSYKRSPSHTIQPVRARGMTFPGPKILDPLAAIDAQCYFLDKIDKSKNSSSSAMRSKSRMAVRLKNFKEKQKKLRQIRLQNRRFKEMRNSGVFSNASMSIQGMSCSKLFVSKMDKDQSLVNNDDMQVITWPLPERFRNETMLFNGYKNIALPKVKVEKNDEDRRNEQKEILVFDGKIINYGFETNKRQKCDEIRRLDVKTDGDDRKKQRKVFVFGSTNGSHATKKHKFGKIWRSTKHNVIKELDDDYENDDDDEGDEDDDDDDNDLKEVPRFGQFEWTGIESMPSTSWNYQDSLRGGLEKNKKTYKDGFQRSRSNKKQTEDATPGPSRLSSIWREKRKRVYTGLPSSLGVAHHVIQKLRAEVKSKENEVDGLQNKLDDMKEVIKKQLKHEVKTKCKLVAVKRKYKSMRLCEISRRGSVLTPKRSRRHKNGGSTEEDCCVKEPACKRKRLQLPARNTEEATSRTHHMASDRQGQSISIENDVENNDKQFSLYPNLQEELRKLQKEVDGSKSSNISQKMFPVDAGIKESQEKGRDVRQHQCSQSQAIDFSYFKKSCSLHLQSQPLENNWKLENEQDGSPSQHRVPTAPQTGHIFKCSHYGTTKPQSLPSTSQHPSFLDNAPSWGYGCDHLNFSPPRPALLPTPTPPCPPFPMDLKQAPASSPIRQPNVFKKPNTRPYYNKRSLPPWKYQCSRMNYHEDPTPTNFCPSIPPNRIPNIHYLGHQCPIYNQNDCVHNCQNVCTNSRCVNNEMARAQRELANRIAIEKYYSYPPPTNNSIPFYQPQQIIDSYQENPAPYPMETPISVYDFNQYYKEPCQYRCDSFGS